MMKRSIALLLTTLLLGLSGAGFAQSAADGVMVIDPYVRAVPPGQPNSASFLTLQNSDSQAHALVGAESPVSKVVELHAHTMVDGMMRMRPVEKIDVPAGGAVALQPGGLHVMLIGLQQQLVPGEGVGLTLIFEDGSKKQVTAPVRKLQMHMRQMQHKHQMQQ
jgi:copper(I)-binding protein